MEHLIIQEYRRGNNFGRNLDMDFEIIEPGIVNYWMIVQEQHLATPSAAHGGVIAGFMDALLGVGALSAVCDEMDIVSTVEFKISYFAPCLIKDKLTGTTKLLKKGKSLVFLEGEIYNQNGVLVAKGNGTFNRYPALKIGY